MKIQNLLNLRTHLNTTNLHVQLQIIRDNISIIKNYMNSSDYKHQFYTVKEDVRKELIVQSSTRKNIEKRINENEQLSFRFGLPLP